MKNSPTPITGRVLLATAGLLFAGGHANAQSPPPAESTPAVAQPASPDDAEFKRKFLRNLHELIINGLSEEEILKKLPLELKKKEFDPTLNFNSLAFGGLGYPDGQTLSEYLDKKIKDSIFLYQKSISASREMILFKSLGLHLGHSSSCEIHLPPLNRLQLTYLTRRLHEEIFRNFAMA
jgi:hypothetical protein